MSLKFTTDDIIKRFRVKHGEKYDYSKVTYTGIFNKVTIICPEHGEFTQSAKKHGDGDGCPACGQIKRGLSRRCTHESFIARAKAAHGERYDYTKTIYELEKKPVIITCREHGDFKQTPASHMKGNGCPVCANIATGDSSRSNTQDFIEKAREVHGDKYDYSETDYIGAKTKVTIICPIHGEFKQTPSNHLHGFGCTACGSDRMAGLRRKSRETFIEESRKIHGDKYDYSKVDYKSCNSRVIIICPVHGEFKQLASVHVYNGSGCRKCAATSLSERFTLDTEIFIEKARKVHGDKYDYSKAIYKGNNKHLTIICPVHGEFNQFPSNHYKGCGCEKCTDVHGGEGYVYLLATKSMLKIGKVKNNHQFNVESRIARMFKSQRESAPDFIEGGMFQLCGLYKFNDGTFVEAGKAERKAHKHFKEHHCSSLPKFDGFNEYFKVDFEEVADYLVSIGGVKVA